MTILTATGARNRRRITRLTSINLDDPESCWFLWNQFDAANRDKLENKLVTEHRNLEPGAKELGLWFIDRELKRATGYLSEDDQALIDEIKERLGL